MWFTWVLFRALMTCDTGIKGDCPILSPQVVNFVPESSSTKCPNGFHQNQLPLIQENAQYQTMEGFGHHPTHISPPTAAGPIVFFFLVSASTSVEGSQQWLEISTVRRGLSVLSFSERDVSSTMIYCTWYLHQPSPTPCHQTNLYSSPSCFQTLAYLSMPSNPTTHIPHPPVNVSFAFILRLNAWQQNVQRENILTIPIILRMASFYTPSHTKWFFLPSFDTPNPFNPCRSRRAAAACPQVAEGYMKWLDSLVKQEQRQ